MPQPSKTMSLRRPTQSQDGHHYQYSNRLISSHIRVLCILPGFEEGPIECQLEERDLQNDVIEEALSYVWGEPIFDEFINIDGRAFRVTRNLDNIIRSLRDREVIRTIWIDAICINQSDLEEKSQQVRFMRDIYSKAQKTTIWLGDWPTEQVISESNLMEDPDYILTLALLRFEGGTVDKYDLSGILEEVLKYETDTWDERGLALAIMLFRCLNSIMTHKWWERVWTIQEAALSPNEPIIHFRGYSFLLCTVISAIDVANNIVHKRRDIFDPLYASFEENHATHFMAASLLRYMLQWQEMGRSRDSLLFLRPGAQIGNRMANVQDRIFPTLLGVVHTYRATDPRDQIFALESLLIESAGRLINVDYTESTETVFRRITARCLNQLPEKSISLYGLLIEDQNNHTIDFSGPSWVHNFAYSGVKIGGVKTRKTIHQIIHSPDRERPILECSSGQAICYATPKTLFCSGVTMSIICYTQQVPDLSQTDSEGLSEYFKTTRQEWLDLVMTDRSLQEHKQGTTMENSKTREKDAGESAVAENFSQFPNQSKFWKLLMLDSASRDNLSVKVPSASSISWESVSAFQKTTGTHLFVTKNGIMGLATAPVQEDDVLAIIHKYPNYVILRPVESHWSTSQNEGKHRIVARAAITDNQDEIRARIDAGLEDCIFQII
ncbi:heterokaryon incompatibility protein-domain-containing protein [Xylaria curta]|nr:heterokaryon incompatibility protein-domain-containing protein [Xylaria curta]